MKRLFLVLILGIPGIVLAQTVNYKFTLDDPSQVRNLSLAPFYYGFNFGLKATPVGFALFYTGHHISAETNYEIGGTNSDTSMANIKQYNEFGLNVAVNFSDKTEPVTQKVTLSHSSDGTYRYEKFFEVDATARKIKAVRIGYSGFNSYLQTSVHALSAPTNYSNEFLNYRTSMIYIGYLSKRIFNYVLDYGNIRTMKRMREFYCDLMFPISSIRDNTKLPEAPDYGNAWPVHHSWGGRIGWMSHSARVVGLYFKLEGGWLPGWQQASNSGSFYTTVMFGFCFSSGVAKNIQL